MLTHLEQLNFARLVPSQHVLPLLHRRLLNKMTMYDRALVLLYTVQQLTLHPIPYLHPSIANSMHIQPLIQC